MPQRVEEETDVEFLYESGPMECQLCSTSLYKLSLEQRNAHYNRHFADEPQPSGSNSTPPRSKTTKIKPTPRRVKDVPPARQNVFWTQMHAVEPPKNFTPGLIPTLKRALIKTHAKGLTTRAMLCHSAATHVATELWDMGWGCGYRNFLMVCTALLAQNVQPLYFPLLDDPTPPGVRNLQIWIQDAWANGFDRDGAEQLRHKLVGTRKWIGTADLYVAFVSRGIPAQLVDFPGSDRGPEAVTEWVIKYFSPPVLSKGHTNAFDALKGASPVVCTERMPLILQHSGHSRTVVGVEVNKKGSTNLLIFDPSRKPRASLRRAGLGGNAFMPSPSKGQSGPSSILGRVLHPHDNRSDRKGHKRSTAFDEDNRETKRARGGLKSPATKGSSLMVDDGEEEQGGEESDVESLDPTDVINFFRVTPTKLGKNDRYQILWFPLDPPLEDAERWARRMVTSEQVV